MLRGVCGISLGVVLGYIFVLKKQCVLRVKTWVIDALGLISLCLFLVFAIFPTSQSYDRYLLIIVPFLLLACFVEKSLFNKLFGNKYCAILGGVLLANVGVSWKNHNSVICTVKDSL